MKMVVEIINNNYWIIKRSLQIMNVIKKILIDKLDNHNNHSKNFYSNNNSKNNNSSKTIIQTTTNSFGLLGQPLHGVPSFRDSTTTTLVGVNENSVSINLRVPRFDIAFSSLFQLVSELIQWLEFLRHSCFEIVRPLHEADRGSFYVIRSKIHHISSDEYVRSQNGPKSQTCLVIIVWSRSWTLFSFIPRNFCIYL